MRVKMEELKRFFLKYRGALIGLIVAIILLALQIYKIIIGAIVIVAGMFLGNYIQYNKEYVKEKLKDFIDKF